MLRVNMSNGDSLSHVGKQMLPLHPALPRKQGESIPDPCRGQRMSCLQPVSQGGSGSVLDSDTKSTGTAYAVLATELPRELRWKQQQQKMVQGLKHMTRGRWEAMCDGSMRALDYGIFVLHWWGRGERR